jgi:hypothetical protein
MHTGKLAERTVTNNGMRLCDWDGEIRGEAKIMNQIRITCLTGRSTAVREWN